MCPCLSLCVTLSSGSKIKHYLSKAKSDYARFFKKMIAYYRPELTAHFEDRFFHFKPSGRVGNPPPFHSQK